MQRNETHCNELFKLALSGVQHGLSKGTVHDLVYEYIQLRIIFLELSMKRKKPLNMYAQHQQETRLL